MHPLPRLPFELLLVSTLLSSVAFSLPRSDPDVARATDRKLHGKFLHITDFHPDPYFKVYSSTDAEGTCHRGNGSAGYYGAETSSCDSPLSLVDATFEWIDKNIKDEIDFIVWTGDSARHDNDDNIPRSNVQVLEQNEYVVDKFVKVFGRKGKKDSIESTQDLQIPIVPNFGNNDILPHNIFTAGPNFWTNKYLNIWRHFIPEEQRHQFQRGGWFYVEAIPDELAIFSLNTMYFFDSNSAVDGCAAKSEPGYEQFEWLRIQLQFMRERGMKAILIGHVPPARTYNKMSWDETCWQKYTFWMRQYRDVVLATFYGHMNIAHFMLQDFDDITPDVLDGRMDPRVLSRESLGDEVTTESATDYLLDLRDEWSRLPSKEISKSRDASGYFEEPGWLSWLWESFLAQVSAESKKHKDDKKHRKKKAEERFLKKIGGKWGERYSVTHVQASVVPNYFPTLRIFEYNTTGLGKKHHSALLERSAQGQAVLFNDIEDVNSEAGNLKKTKKHKFKVPEGPSKSTPPGPAYSPQTLSLLGYTQYFANLTHINNDFTLDSENENDFGDGDFQDDDDFQDERWKPGKHHGKHPHKHKDHKPHPKKFKYEVEYSTFDDKVFGLKDLTVRSYLKLAQKIGSYTPGAWEEGIDDDTIVDMEDGEVDADKKKKKKKKHKHRHPKHKTKQWLAFVRRAFVETIDPASIEAMPEAEQQEL